MPGVGPITAMAIETFAPPMEVFCRLLDFAAWLELVPVQHSTGGKQVLRKPRMIEQFVELEIDCFCGQLPPVQCRIKDTESGERQLCSAFGRRSLAESVGEPMFKSMKNFASDDSGVTAIEYALIASLIAVFIIVAVQLVGTQVSTVFTEVGNSLK
jgi:Flp pilus assembly pilin Flp